MSSPTIIKVSTIALLFALAGTPLTATYAQSPQASPQGQENGQGTPASVNSNAGTNPNSGPGNNSGQGNTSPASVSETDNATAGTETSQGSSTTSPSSNTRDGHDCGGEGHIDNDAPGHQYDDCQAEPTGAQQGAAAAAKGLPGGAKAPAVAATNAGVVANRVPAGSAASAAASCSGFAEALVPIFGTLTQREANVVATADTAALVPVACPDMTVDPDAQQAVAENPGLVSALAAQGHGVDQVITVEVTESVPTIYVEAATP